MVKKNWFNYLVIICVSLFYFFILFDSNTFYYAHDMEFHATNMIAMASEISFKNWLPGKILPDLVNNLGYGVNIFYPSFPHLVGAYVYKVLGSIPLTFKLLSFILINLSGIAMFEFVKRVFKNKKQALMSAVTYISMPYFFADFFIRCAWNECFLFLTIPVIMLGIHYLIDEDNKLMFYLLFVIGYVISINSHLVMSIYLTIILIIYLLFQWKKVFKKEVILHFLIASVFIILLDLDFIVPLLEHHNLGIYNIFNIDYDGVKSVQVAYLFNYFLPVKWIDITMYIPLLLLVGIGYLFMKLPKVNNKNKKIIISMYTILFFSLVLAIVRPVWYLFPNILRNIQFGWRMSIFIVVSVSILFGYVIRVLKSDLKKFFMVNFILMFAICNFFSSLLIVREDIKKDYLTVSEDKQWAQEYLPTSSVENIFVIKNKGLNLSRKYEKNIEIISNEVPKMEFVVKDLEKEITIEFPRIYYIGYELKDESGKVYKINRSNAGLLRAEIEKDGVYNLDYVGSKLANVATVITKVSYLLFGMFLGSIIYIGKVRKKDGDK